MASRNFSSLAMINFLKGHPDRSLLPMEEVTAAANAIAGQPEWLQYGGNLGNDIAREQVASFLSRQYQLNVVKENLVLTSGVSHGISLLCDVLLRKHAIQNNGAQQPLCFLEDPTYFLVKNIFVQKGFDISYIPTQVHNGLNIEALEEAIQGEPKDRLLILYCIPTHHNPLGISIEESQKQALAQLCQKYPNFYIIADEVYHCLTFSSYIKPMAMRSPQVLSVSAFTKILGPGIRCGWIQTCDEQIVKDLDQDAVLNSAGCPSQYTSGLMQQLIRSNVLEGRVLPHLCQEFQERCHHLCYLLQTRLPDCRFEHPQGGYFVWVRLPKHIQNMSSFQTWCQQEHGVNFLPSTRCSSSEATAAKDECQVRLCFAFYSKELMTEGIERLRKAIDTYRSDANL